MNPVTVLSLGAGVQSSALLLMSDRREVERADFAVFADTQAEPENVYEWLRWLRLQVSIPILQGSAGNLESDGLEAAKGKRRSASIPYFVRNPDGTNGMARRQCTKEYKLEVVHRLTRQKLGYQKGERVKHKVRMLIGISIDEASRMKPSRKPWIENVYPLVDLRKSRQDAIAYVEKALGKTPPRSACVMCPFHSDTEWRRMKEQEPSSFKRAVAFDKAIRRQPKFRGENYLHSDRKPLDEVDFGEAHPDLFQNECEGMCGV